MDDYLTPALGYIGGSLRRARVDPRPDRRERGRRRRLGDGAQRRDRDGRSRCRARVAGAHRADAAPVRSGRGAGGTRRRLRELLAAQRSRSRCRRSTSSACRSRPRGGVGDVDEPRLRVPDRRRDRRRRRLVSRARDLGAADPVGNRRSAGRDARRRVVVARAAGDRRHGGDLRRRGQLDPARGARQLLRHRCRRGDRPARRGARSLDGDVGRRLGDVPARLRGRPRRPTAAIALAAIVLHLPLAFAGQAVAGLWGLAAALAISTALALRLDARAARRARRDARRARGRGGHRGRRSPLPPSGSRRSSSTTAARRSAGTAIFVAGRRRAAPARDCARRGRTSGSSHERVRGRGRPQLERPRADGALPRLPRRGDVPGRPGDPRRQRLERRYGRGRGAPYPEVELVGLPDEPRLRRRRERRHRSRARARTPSTSSCSTTTRPSSRASCSRSSARSAGLGRGRVLADPPGGLGDDLVRRCRYDPRRGHQGRHTGYGRPALPQTIAPYPTDRGCGGAMLVPRAALERVGLLDEALFAYAEDVDWSLRARAPASRSSSSRRASSIIESPPPRAERRRLRRSTTRFATGSSSPSDTHRSDGCARSAVAPRPSRRSSSRRSGRARRVAGLRAVLQGLRDASRRRLGPRAA